METPYTDHLKRKDYEFVYEPAEDSFLLLDALEKDLSYIEYLAPHICLEIGSGSGVIITALSKRLSTSLCLSTDISQFACDATLRTSKRNECFVDIINTNLTQGIRENIIDLLVFNPPYVVTDTEELENLSLSSPGRNVTSKQLIQTWAGGKHGCEVIDALIVNLNQILSQSGVLYLLVLKQNRPDILTKKLKKLGFQTEIFMDRKIPGEHLLVLKITRFIMK